MRCRFGRRCPGRGDASRPRDSSCHPAGERRTRQAHGALSQSRLCSRESRRHSNKRYTKWFARGRWAALGARPHPHASTRYRRPAQRRQVHALQRAHVRGGPRRQLPVCDHRAQHRHRDGARPAPRRAREAGVARARRAGVGGVRRHRRPREGRQPGRRPRQPVPPQHPRSRRHRPRRPLLRGREHPARDGRARPGARPRDHQHRTRTGRPLDDGEAAREVDQDGAFG